MGVGPACQHRSPLAFLSGGWATFPTRGTVPLTGGNWLVTNYSSLLVIDTSKALTINTENFSSILNSKFSSIFSSLIGELEFCLLC